MDKKPKKQKKKKKLGNFFSSEKNRVRLELILLFTILGLGLVLFFSKSYEKEYRIRFESMGGSHVASLRVKANTTISEPLPPTKEGYVFEGWYEEGTRFDFSRPITRNLKLIAKWKENKE